MVLKKSKKDNKILFIDATTEFIRGGSKNKLSEDNRKKILNAYIGRKDIEYFAKVIDNKSISENDYKIDVSSYVTGEDKREIIDITTLNLEISKIVTNQNKLRMAIDEIVKDIEGIK